MVLKYRGFKENWCYVEAPSFTIRRFVMPEFSSPNEDESQEAQTKKINDAYRKAEEYIRLQMGLADEAISFLIGDTNIYDLHNCTAVVPDDRKPRDAFILNREAYLVTDNGKTIERIA